MLAAPFLLAGCGKYADFILPPLAGGEPGATYSWEPFTDAVLRPGVQWDTHDALNPSVIDGREMFYSGYDGQTWRTLYARSGDGIHWRKLGAVLAPDANSWEGSYIAANGSALRHSGRFWYWYVAGQRGAHRIGLAWSADGLAWSKQPAPVLENGPRGAWDECAVADPYVIRIESYFYMFYLGQDRARPPQQRLGLARSRDGIHWQKLRTNPILQLGTAPSGPGAFDENGLGEPAVWSARGFYWMLYTGRDASENRRLGLARSTDGVHWRKLPAIFSGTEGWNSRVICDPSVVVNAQEVRVWFGGGNIARPDENLNGQIGYAVLRPVDATLAR